MITVNIFVLSLFDNPFNFLLCFFSFIFFLHTETQPSLNGPDSMEAKLKLGMTIWTFQGKKVPSAFKSFGEIVAKITHSYQ